MLGLGGGAAGTGFDNAAQANIVDQGGVGVSGGAGEAYYRSQAALNSQQNLLSALQQQGGLQKQVGVFGQLGDVAAGKGPNPAQAMLNQRTGENVANQAALMAGQRGAGANVGLMARQIAGQGAGLQQQAVGQGATMQAEQSLNALGQMGGMANTMAANQMAGTNAATSAEQAQHGALLNALAAQNQARVSSQSSVNSANAGLAQTQMGAQQGLAGGLLGAAGSVAGTVLGGPAGGALAKASLPGKAHGGAIDNSAGPQSLFGQFLHRSSGGGVSGGSMVDVVLSPGEKVVPPNKVNEAAGGSVEAKTVPGQANVGGDSVKNDTYKTKLPEGSIVVPRTKAKDNRDSAAFVRKVLAQRGRVK